MTNCRVSPFGAGIRREMCSMECNSFFIEFLPRIQTAHVCVSTTSSQLTFTSNQILQTIPNGGQEVLTCWEDSQLLVTSHQSLKLIQGERLHVRFKALTQGRLAAQKILLCDKLTEYGCKECLLSIKCSFCGAQFVRKDHSFQRVLPLPSDSWEEVSSHLFCHRHDNHGDGKDLSSPVKLLPKEGDCLISYDLILLRTSALDCDTITAKDEMNGLYCARCQLNVGVDVNGKTWKFLRSKVRLAHCSELDSGRVLNQRIILEEYFARKLHTHSKSNTSFKFLIKDQLKRVYLQVWMLNAVSSLLLSDSLSSGIIDKFSGFANQSHHKDDVVLKILYKNKLAVPKQEQESKVTDVLQISTEESLQLLLLLVASTRVMPPSQRVANGYQVGFLRLNL